MPLDSNEFSSLASIRLVILIFISFLFLNYIPKENNHNYQNEFVLSPQAYSFYANEFINSVETLGNKMVSMDYLASSKNIPLYYFYIKLLLKNTKSFNTLEQNLINDHGEFIKHYYIAHQSYLSICAKILKSFSTLEQNIESILEYNYYQNTPIIMRLRTDSNITGSQNIFYRIYQLLFLGKQNENRVNELDDFIMVDSLKTLIDDLMDIQNEIDAALHRTLLLSKYSDQLFYQINLTKYEIEDLINYYEHPLGNLMYMVRNFKKVDEDKGVLENDLKKIISSKKSALDLSLVLKKLLKNFSTSKEYLELCRRYFKEIWGDMKVIEKKELNEWEIKRLEKILVGVKENYEKSSFLLSVLSKS